jgi:hypothetical protein
MSFSSIWGTPAASSGGSSFWNSAGNYFNQTASGDVAIAYSYAALSQNKPLARASLVATAGVSIGLALLPAAAAAEGAATATRAVWVGADGLAEAQASCSEILQLSKEAQAALDAGDPTLMIEESAEFAKGATGNTAKAFIGNGQGATFWGTEWPQMLQNLEGGTLGNIDITF